MVNGQPFGQCGADRGRILAIDMAAFNPLPNGAGNLGNALGASPENRHMISLRVGCLGNRQSDAGRAADDYDVLTRLWHGLSPFR